MELQEAIRIIKDKPGRDVISKIQVHENRVALHCDAALNSFDAPGVKDFLSFVEMLLPKDKVEKFKTLMRFPVDTVELTGEVFNALEKIFDGVNPQRKYLFADESTEQDFEQYLEKKEWEDFIKNDVFNEYKVAPGSVMVIDMPKDQKKERPEPYAVIIKSGQIKGYNFKNGQFLWIWFESNGVQYIYDEQEYASFKLVDESIIEYETSPHDLRYCPARFIIGAALNSKNEEVKENPVSKYLGRLDFLLFYEGAKKYSDLYAPFPIYWAYEQDCDYEIEAEGQNIYCQGGYLRNDERFLGSYQDVKKCPICANKVTGVGAMIDVPAPDKDSPSLVPPAGVINVDINSLEYNVKEIERLRTAIYEGATGNSMEAINDQAVNVKQVQALFESRKQTLMKTKKTFEQLEEWALFTIAALRYGEGFENVHIDYGTDFYLLSVSDLNEIYNATPDIIYKDYLQEQIYRTTYRNNPEEYQRALMIQHILYGRHLGKDDVIELTEKGVIDKKDALLNINISSLIMRFERENVKINNFGVNLPYNIRVDRIRNTLLNYLN